MGHEANRVIKRFPELPDSVRQISLPEFRRTSSWASRAETGLHNRVGNRTPDGTLREYEVEKWGVLLNAVDSSHVVSPSHLDELFLGSENVIFNIGKKLYSGPSHIARRLTNQMAFSFLDTVPGIETLAELGAGYGSVILGYQVHSRSHRSISKFIGLDFSNSALKLIQKVGLPNITEAVFHDFSRPGTLRLPEDSVVITHMAYVMVPKLMRSAIEDIINSKPKLVIHFETIKEDFADDDLGGLRRAYLQDNRYNENLWTLLREFQKEGAIEILQHAPSVYGENCLLPTSIVTWRPI